MLAAYGTRGDAFAAAGTRIRIRRVPRRRSLQSLLPTLVVVRLALPSQFVIGPLGGAGAPATLFGLLLLVYWLWHRLRRAVPERAAAVNAVAMAFTAAALSS